MIALTVLLCVVCVCLTLLYGWHDWTRVRRSERLSERQIQDRISLREHALAEGQAKDSYALEQRRVAVEERRLALDEKQRADSPRPTPMPQDLVDRIRSWDEPFQQDDEKATLMALYSEYGSWDEVRKHLTPLRPYMSLEIVAPRDGMMQ